MPFAIRSRRFSLLLAAGAGLAYALLMRLGFGGGFGHADNLLSQGFLVGTPLGLGALTAWAAGPERSGYYRVYAAPAAAVSLFALAAFAFSLEGLVCLIIILPVFYLLGIVGAAFYLLMERLINGPQPPRRQPLAVAGLALLPLLIAPLEQRWAGPAQVRRVENVLVLDAPVAVVWQHVIRVDSIRPAELPASLTDAIGFPRPVAATLTRTGVGGVRHATFERGVEFVETVDDWQPLRQLSFSIRANTATIPPATFDEHVTVGGRYFDVLRGTYRLEALAPTRTRLVLFSEQRLSTHVNAYAGLWTDWVMGEIQGRILHVLKARCEAARPGA